jgi:aminopeptidase N
MLWDEETYGREYDLDIFNIVAVDDFNMGAMENKSLNIFNSSCVLASPQTTTDAGFQRVEAIVAHEYFHNWSGNRVTCRDWFQLSLKEGFTVFRDAEFSADVGSRTVKRVEDVCLLRTVQFAEDGGPMAHPVRPNSFIEISNFYTVTVYEKGAEVIGMLKRFVGADAYADACTLYFARRDGQAATIEDWLAAFEDTTGRDLTQFARWYCQAGTPHLHVTERWDGDTYTFTLRQDLRPTPDGSPKDPQVIPVDIGLIGPDGTEVLATQTLILTDLAETFRFEGIPKGAVLSVLRDFSAPVIMHHAQSAADKAHLLAHDTVPFNRWDAGHALAGHVLLDMVQTDAAPDTAFLDGLAAVLRDDTLDPAFRALAVSLPSETDTAQAIAQAGGQPDPLAIHHAHEALKLQIAQHLQDIVPRIYAQMTVDGPYDPNAKDAGKRALGNVVLDLISRLDGGAQATSQFAAANNMTQQLTALACCLRVGKGADARAAFFDQWQNDRLVMDKWFGLQVRCAAPDAAVATARMLTDHPKFDWKNPNRFRAVIGGLTGNAAGFHAPDGSGYAFLADCLIRLDPVNPQTTARMATAFDAWAQFDTQRQSQMRGALKRIADTPNLSGDTTEIVSRILG